MKYNEFIELVREDAGFDDHLKAEMISRAVLGTVGELLTSTGRHNFGAQLPDQLKKHISAWQDTLEGEKLVPGLAPERIINTIQARSKLNHTETVKGISAVMQVLRSAISTEQFDEIREQLKTLDPLIEIEK